jgi:hypothetical protein
MHEARAVLPPPCAGDDAGAPGAEQRSRAGAERGTRVPSGRPLPDNLGHGQPRRRRQRRIPARARKQVSARPSPATCLSPISRLATRSGSGGEPALSGHPIVAEALVRSAPAATRMRSPMRRAAAGPTLVRRGSCSGYRLSFQMCGFRVRPSLARPCARIRARHRWLCRPPRAIPEALRGRL